MVPLIWSLFMVWPFVVEETGGCGAVPRSRHGVRRAEKFVYAARPGFVRHGRNMNSLKLLKKNKGLGITEFTQNHAHFYIFIAI